jgi:hypothetical protein
VSDESPYEPPQSPVSDPDRPRKGGSVWSGIFIAWLVMVLGETVLVPTGALPTWLLPPAGIVVTGIVMLRGDSPRTGKGLLLGLASVFAVALLLVAACFGLFMMEGGIHD